MVEFQEFSSWLVELEIISSIKGLKTMEETVYKGNLGTELSWCS